MPDDGGSKTRLPDLPPAGLPETGLEDSRVLSELLELSRVLLAAQTRAQVEETLTVSLRRMMHANYAMFLRYEPDLDALRVTSLTGVQWIALDYRLKRGQGLSWQAVQKREVMVVPLSAQIERIPQPRLLENLPEAAMLFAPLFGHHDELLGVISLGREAVDFTLADASVLETYANTAIIALERARQAQKIAEIRDGAMLALGLALEARDYETLGHTGRTVTLAARLGSALNLTDEQLDDLRQGAYLHDIGKLSVPDSVLLKRGRLSADEWRLMRQHTVTGEQLANRVPSVSQGALQVIRSHHERWDGGGYPDSLRGEQIPLLARVFAIVDVFDALTNERPYHEPIVVQETLSFLQAQAGRHFDPAVVQTFLSLLHPGGGELAANTDSV